MESFSCIDFRSTRVINKTIHFVRPLLRLIFGLLVLVAIGRQLTMHLQNGFNAVNFFSYFTNLSNLFAAFVLILGARSQSSLRPTLKPNDQIRAAAVVNMAVVGIVFAVLLRNVDLGSLLPWVNFLLHYVMPVVVILDWLMQPPAMKLGVRHVLLCQIFPVLYFAYVLVRGNHTGWYPYPFLNPANVGGYGGVAFYAAGIAVTFFLSAWSLVASGNKLSRQTELKA